MAHLTKQITFDSEKYFACEISKLAGSTYIFVVPYQLKNEDRRHLILTRAISYCEYGQWKTINFIITCNKNYAVTDLSCFVFILERGNTKTTI